MLRRPTIHPSTAAAWLSVPLLWGLAACGDGPTDAGATPDHLDAPGDHVDDVQITRRDLSTDAFPLFLSYDVALPDRVVSLELERNDDLFQDDYTETRLGPDGTELPHPADAWADARPCWYLGDAIEPDGTRFPVSVRTCAPDGTDIPRHEALEGALSLSDGTWSLVPVNDGTHSLEPMDLKGDCGLDLSDLDLDAQPLLPQTPEIQGMAPTPGLTWIELHAVNDAGRHNAHGGNTEANTADIVNLMMGMYLNANFSSQVRVLLTAQTTFVGADPYTPAGNGVEVDDGDLLTKFNTWAGTNLPPHDNHQLFSQYDFAGGTIGLAGLGAMCSGNSSGSIVQATFADLSNAVIAAHELGHNLNMPHDGSGSAGACPPASHIMGSSFNPYAPSVAPTAFSSCSVSITNAFLPSIDCLDDTPTSAYGGPSCGNGLVEVGEECDCGPGGCAGIDPCCEASTCQLTAQATCSAQDACCDPNTCDVASAGTTCRDAADPSCDVAETCNGVASTCPDDIVEPAGTDCTDTSGGNGACYEGACKSYDEQCNSLSSTFNISLFDDPVCQQWFVVNDPCGDLICGTGGGCTTLSYNGSTVQADDGVPCGTDMQCFEGTCTPSDDLAPEDACPDDPNKVNPGECGCGTAETDADSDGAPDCIDDCPTDPGKTEPGTCGCGSSDADSDSDGTLDCFDACPTDAAKIEPGICGCGTLDRDADEDGALDCFDACPWDGDKISEGVCGCGVADVDSDGDGALDCNDLCSTDPLKTEPGVCGCFQDEADSDEDGTPDCNDLCPTDPWKSEPGTCGCGVADTDGDQDGAMDCFDACPDDPAKTAPGECGCGVSDADLNNNGTADCLDPDDVPDDSSDTDDTETPESEPEPEPEPEPEVEEPETPAREGRWARWGCSQTGNAGGTWALGGLALLALTRRRRR